MMLIDTHSHLNFAAFAESWPAAADRARADGVGAIVMPGSQYSTSVRAVALARERPGFLYGAVGLHPTHVRPQVEQRDQKIEIRDWENEKFEDFDYERYLELAKQPSVVAIGEVGLDTYRLSEIRKQRSEIRDWINEQERVLREFIAIAQGVKKPLILHCRGSKKPENSDQKIDLPAGEAGMRDQANPHERLIEILGAIPVQMRPRFVVHCYQGTVEQAGRYLALGGYISFTGTITYSNDAAVTEVVRAVPLERLMIETDSPYLSPVPYRGEQNEPWKVIEVARRVAELQAISLDLVAEQTTSTARMFFGFK